ncbi:hypothetical protein AB0L56_10995 [Streptomyces sp. NPDC052079]|uniref:hypothetical protein n=1 Tax=Streptomyces sp. NPDC052079 TaxID=3155526 RepID=UPI00342B5EA6
MHSETGRLTVSELLREAGVRRDVDYGDHKDLIEAFQAPRTIWSTVAQALAEQVAELKAKLADAAAALASERATTTELRKIVAELDLELHAVREGSGPVQIASLPVRRRQPGLGPDRGNIAGPFRHGLTVSRPRRLIKPTGGKVGMRRRCRSR